MGDAEIIPIGTRGRPGTCGRPGTRCRSTGHCPGGFRPR